MVGISHALKLIVIVGISSKNSDGDELEKKGLKTKAIAGDAAQIGIENENRSILNSSSMQSNS